MRPHSSSTGSEKDLYGISEAPALQPTLKRIETLAIPTRSRPETLKRVISSIAAQFETFSRAAEVLVIDDSSEASQRGRNSSVLNESATEYGLHIKCSNRLRLRNFADEIARESGVNPRIASFAMSDRHIDYISVGACRNAVLFEALDRTVLFIDDDVVCRTAIVPGASDEVAVGPYGFQSWFFANQDEVNGIRFAVEDLLLLHERALSIDSRLLTLAEPRIQGRKSVSDDMSHGPMSGRRGSQVSLMGIVGDAATSDPLIYLLQGPETRIRLTATKEVYQNAMTNRLVLCGPPATILSRYMPCMSYCMGVDNTRLLPPFFPLTRGEEFVFGALLYRCVPDSVFTAIPRAILHVPVDHRLFDFRDALRRAGKLTTAETIAAIVGGGTAIGTSTKDRLKSLSDHLRAIGHSSDVDFCADIREAVRPVVFGQLQALSLAMDECREHGRFCLADIRQIREAYVAAWKGWDYSAPIDIGRRGRDQFREFVISFGELLGGWEEMMQAARTLRSRGLTPFQPLGDC